MKTLRKITALIFGIPVGLALATVICICVSLFWLVFVPWKLVEMYMCQESDRLQTFEEFIFACYGFAGVFVAVPLLILNGEDID